MYVFGGRGNSAGPYNAEVIFSFSFMLCRRLIFLEYRLTLRFKITEQIISLVVILILNSLTFFFFKGGTVL